MGQSKRHHYIPKFYLDGFTNDQGEYFIFDKLKNEIRKSKPENSFFEKYRFSANVGNEKSDLPEIMLAHFENKVSKALRKVRESDFLEDILTPEILHEVRFFIALIFWRIPANDKLREDLIDQWSFTELGFGLFDKTGRRNIEAEDMLKDVELFRKTYTSMLPVLSFTEKFKKSNFNSWRIIHRTNSNHITGDNPIIFKHKYRDLSSTQEELIAPLSSKKILVCTESPVPKVYPPAFNLKMDITILLQSERYVCSSSKEYLELLVNKYYSTIKEHDIKSYMIEHLFGYFTE